MSNAGAADGPAPITARPSAPNSRSASRSTSSPLIGDAAGGRRSRLSAGVCRRCRLSSTFWSAAESCSARAARAPTESALRTEGESESAAESGAAGVTAADPAPRAPPHAVLSVAPSAAPTNASSRIPWVLVIGSRKNSQGYGSSRSTLQAPRPVVDRSRSRQSLCQELRESRVGDALSLNEQGRFRAGLQGVQGPKRPPGALRRRPEGQH